MTFEGLPVARGIYNCRPVMQSSHSGHQAWGSQARFCNVKRVVRVSSRVECGASSVECGACIQVMSLRTLGQPREQWQGGATDMPAADMPAAAAVELLTRVKGSGMGVSPGQLGAAAPGSSMPKRSRRPFARSWARCSPDGSC